jgi:hypothetical protein
VPILIFEDFHFCLLGGHLGIFQSIHKIRKNFVWKGMSTDNVRHCEICGLNKPAQNYRSGLLVSEVPKRPFEKLFDDCVGKLSHSKAGNIMTLVCVDSFSKCVYLVSVIHVFPLKPAQLHGEVKKGFFSLMLVRLNAHSCRSQWPRGLRRGSAAERLLGSWFQIPPGE